MNTIAVKQRENSGVATRQWSSLSSLNGKWIKHGVTIAVIVLIGITAWNLDEAYHLSESIGSTSFLVGTALATIYRVVNPVGWFLTLQGLRQRVPMVSAVEVWLHSESRRWLPGGIWGYASRAVGAKDLGVPLAVGSASMLVELVVTLAAAVFVGTVGTAFYWDQVSAEVAQLASSISMQSQTWWLMAAALIGCCGLVYCGRSIIAKKYHALQQKIAALHAIKFDLGKLLQAFFFFVAMTLLNGLASFAIICAVDDSASVPLLVVVAATSIAWLVGFFAFFSPGGILVREAAFAALLVPWIPYDVGFIIAIGCRFSQLFAEVVGMVAILVRQRFCQTPAGA